MVLVTPSQVVGGHTLGKARRASAIKGAVFNPTIVNNSHRITLLVGALILFLIVGGLIFRRININPEASDARTSTSRSSPLSATESQHKPAPGPIHSAKPVPSVPARNPAPDTARALKDIESGLVGPVSSRRSAKEGDAPKTLLPAVSLPNGTELGRRSGRQGLGTLSIENGNSEDAVVKLILSGNLGMTLRCVYIRGKSSVRLTGIPVGNYRVMFTLGTDWDKAEMKFRHSPSYDEFADALLYRETEETEAIQYSNYRLTLHKVIYGNARTQSINREQFGVANPEPGH